MIGRLLLLLMMLMLGIGLGRIGQEGWIEVGVGDIAGLRIESHIVCSPSNKAYLGQDEFGGRRGHQRYYWILAVP